MLDMQRSNAVCLSFVFSVTALFRYQPSHCLAVCGTFHLSTAGGVLLYPLSGQLGWERCRLLNHLMAMGQKQTRPLNKKQALWVVFFLLKGPVLLVGVCMV